jgi:hypothetical protein
MGFICARVLVIVYNICIDHRDMGGVRATPSLQGTST